MAEPGRYSKYCECGNRKGGCATACKRCLYLDGTLDAQRAVISMLREQTRATALEIEEETELDVRSLYRILARLLGMGRIRRDADDNGAYHYALTSPREMGAT